ncbi:MAG: DUF6301 family protein [Propionibacteriaceae bacterium]|nr:DUF6301 family protein [Propionibacteriaceae bacterium]
MTDHSIPLPDGTTYRTVPVHQGIKVIRTWAEHPWPMTTTQAIALANQLGWVPCPDTPDVFTTNHNIEPQDASFTSTDNVTVSTFNLTLATFAPEELDSITEPATRAAFEAYVQAFTKIYGSGKRKTNKGVTSTTWHLPSGASIYLATIGSVLSSTIDSPQSNEDAAGEERYFDEIMSEEEEEREVPVRPSHYRPKQ